MPRSVKMSADAPGVTVKASDGRELTLRRGMTFLDRPSATAFFQDFAKAQSKRLIIDKRKSGGAQYEYVCASRTPSCQFRIKLLKSRSAQSSHFFVSSFIAQHAVDCAGASKLTVRQAAAVLLADADKVSKSAAVSSVSSVKELQTRLQQSSGETISSRKAYRVRDRILRLAAGQLTRGFQRLESLLRGFQSKNHGAHVAFEKDPTSDMFRRAFLAHPFVAVYQPSKGLQPVLGLETAPLVSLNYRGQLFILLGKDGNNEVISLCVAVASQPDADNWRWFLLHCQQAHVDFSKAIVIADRTKGLLAATEGLGLLVRQCTQHLIATLKDMVKTLPTEQVADLVLRAQAADSEAEFSSCLSMIGLTCATAEKYLRSLDPQTWSLFCLAQQIKSYGWNSTQFVPDTHKAVLSLAPFDLMQHFMAQFMTFHYKQSGLAKKWTEEGKVLTEYAEKLLAEQHKDATFQVVQPSDDSIMFVTESRSFPPRRYRVDLTQRVCSCTYLYQMGIPCRHVLAALLFVKRTIDEVEYVDMCYRTSTFAEQYDSGSIELLLDSELEEDHAVRAPIMACKRGRPKKQPLVAAANDAFMTPAVATTLLSHETKIVLHGNQIRSKRCCSTCGKTGHSKRTCEMNDGA